VPGRPKRSQFEDLMLPHLDAAYNLACWLLRDAHEAEDAVQDAYLKAYEALPQYRGGSSAAWLLKIVRNTCLTMLRRRKGRSNVIVLRDMLSDDDPLLRSALRDVTSVPERQVIAKAEQEAVRAALAGLPEHYREIVVLREFEDMSYQEIADITQLPIGTVMSRLSRARRALREALIESGEGDERSKL
jgi:RNA polymerase sigma factor (sigma-70 family)